MPPTARAALVPLFLLAAAACRADGPGDPAAGRVITSRYVPPVVAGETYQRVLVFGDWGTGRRGQKRTARAMARRIRALPRHRIDFMLTTGDNFYPLGVQSADDPQWKTKFESIYADPLLQVPVWATLGNHDHYGDPQAQVEYAKHSKRWKLPARYYTFTKPLGKKPAAEGARRPSVEFFCVDSTPLGYKTEPKQQLRWLEQKLAASRATWKVVVGHHPLYSYSRRPFNRTLIRRLEPLFVKHKVDLYLAGHDHVLELLKPIKGVHYAVSGGGGGPGKAYGVRWTQDEYYAATGGGFLLMRIGANDLVLEFVRMNGKTQYAHTLYKKRRGPF